MVSAPFARFSDKILHKTRPRFDSATAPAFVYRPDDWVHERRLYGRVSLLKAIHKRTQPQYVVRKTLDKNVDGVRDKRPREMQRLE